MTHTSFSRRWAQSLTVAGTRVAAITIGLSIAAASCKTSEILNVTTPDVLTPGVFNTPTGTDPLRFGVISDFTVGFDGSTDSFTTMSGDMSDEMVATDTFAERLSVNARSP